MSREVDLEELGTEELGTEELGQGGEELVEETVGASEDGS